MVVPEVVEMTFDVHADGVEDKRHEESRARVRRELLYSVSDHPPCFLALFLGFQHYLLILGSVSVPLLLTPYMCIGDDTVGQSEVIGTNFFVMGLATALQSTIGSRLPIVQGASFSFAPPIIATLSLPQWKCPDEPAGLLNSTDDLLAWRREVWMSRMREIQGALAVSSLVQVLLGFTGLIGAALRYIGPLSIAPSITLIGLHLFPVAADYCGTHWGIAVLTVGLVILFSQYIRNVKVPCPKYNRGQGCSRTGYPVFKLFPVVLAIVITWIFCVILTTTDVFPTNPAAYGYQARSDVRLDAIKEAKWFRFPYPGQWGLPTVSAAAVLGMLAGTISGVIESIGDYYACARIAGAPPPPTHAMNRGVMMEGVGILCAGLWGSSSGLTSFSENIGAIGITKIGSRRVIQFAGLCMMVFGCLGKFGALFTSIPPPIIGGLFLCVFGLVTAVGISNLQFTDLNSTRNLFIFGFSVMIGMTVPHWMATHAHLIQTGSTAADQIISVLLKTPMFIGGVVGFILDNTIPGTDEERGIKAWRRQEATGPDSAGAVAAAYDLPLVMRWIRRWTWTRYVPICPTFNVKFPSCSCPAWCHCPGKTGREDTKLNDTAAGRQDIKLNDTPRGGSLTRVTHV